MLAFSKGLHPLEDNITTLALLQDIKDWAEMYYMLRFTNEDLFQSFYSCVFAPHLNDGDSMNYKLMEPITNNKPGLSYLESLQPIMVANVNEPLLNVLLRTSVESLGENEDLWEDIERVLCDSPQLRPLLEEYVKATVPKIENQQEIRQKVWKILVFHNYSLANSIVFSNCNCESRNFTCLPNDAV